MSVADKLRAFRYTTVEATGGAASARVLPWGAIRAVNVAAMKAEEPDLHLMKNLLSLLSDFTITSSTVRGATDADLLQLLQLMQASLQFALHSQCVLKGELVARQNLDALRQVSAKYVEQMDAKVAVLTADKAALQEERDTLRLSAEALRHSLVEREATARTLERQLQRERERFDATVARQEKLLQLTQPVTKVASSGSSAAACPTCGRTLSMTGAAQVTPVVVGEAAADSGAMKVNPPDRPSAGRALEQDRRRIKRSATGETHSQTSLTDSVGRGIDDESEDALALLHQRRGQRPHHKRKGKGYIDVDTLNEFAALVLRQQQQAPHADRSRTHRHGGSRDASADDRHARPRYARTQRSYDALLLDSETSATDTLASTERSVEAVRRRRSSTAGRRHQPRPGEAVKPACTASVRELLQEAVGGLKQVLSEQLSAITQTVAATTQQLSADMAQLKRAQSRLDAKLSGVSAVQKQQQPSQQQQQARRSPVRGSPLNPQRSSPTPSAVAPPDLPRPLPPSLRGPVTPPAATSLPLTPMDSTFSLSKPMAADGSAFLRAATPGIQAAEDAPLAPPRATEEATATRSAPAAVPPTAHATVEGGEREAAATVRRHSPRDDSLVPSTTNDTLTTGVSVSERKASRAPPSMQTSSLSIKSRSSLPDFDVSLLRTPPKEGRDKPRTRQDILTNHSNSSSPAIASASPEERKGAVGASAEKLGSEPPARATAASGTANSETVGSLQRAASGGAKSWYDTPSEELPASAAARAAPQPSGPEGTSPAISSVLGSGLPFDPASRSPSAVPFSPDEGEEAPTGTCEHCQQKMPRTELKPHEKNCDLRLIPCASCGRRIVARFMPRHQCTAPSSEKGAEMTGSRPNSVHVTMAPADAGGDPHPQYRDSLENSRVSSQYGSLGPKRASSLLLQETQRELQQLLEEEEAFQRSRNNPSNTSSP